MAPSPVIKVHDYETFCQLINTGLTIVDFTATWCGPCRRIAPIYDVFATEYSKLIPELKFLKVDVDELPQAAQGVAGMPTFQFWIAGERIDSLTTMGANVDKLRENISNFLLGNYVRSNRTQDEERVSMDTEVTETEQNETTQVSMEEHE